MKRAFQGGCVGKINLSDMDCGFWMRRHMVCRQIGKMEKVGIYPWFNITARLVLYGDNLQAVGRPDIVRLVHICMGAGHL